MDQRHPSGEYNKNTKEIVGNDKDNRWIPRVLVIGPGGFKGMKALGFLSPIEDVGLLEYIDTYCGVSVGAIISLLIVAGYEIREIVGEAATLDLFKDMENLTIKSIMDNRGIISNEPVRKKLTQLLLNKFGIIPTLHGLYLQTGKAYIAVTLNATDDECEMMGPFTHPNVSCLDATMFSMNIPFVFYQLKYHGKTYVDGALGNPYPVDYFDDGNTNILGIYMKTIYINGGPSQRTNPGIILKKIEDSRDNSLPVGTYFYKIVNSLMNQRRNHIIQQSTLKCKHVCLETENLDIIGYSMNKEEKAQMLVEGFNEGKKFIDQLGKSEYQQKSYKKMYMYPPYYLSEGLICDEDNDQNKSEILLMRDQEQPFVDNINILSAMTVKDNK